MSFGKRGVVQAGPPTIIGQQKYAEMRTPWLLSLAFGAGMALLFFVVIWWAYGLGFATKHMIVAFCFFTVIFAVGEINVRAIVRTIHLGLQRKVRGMLHGLMFIAGANIAVVASAFCGLILAQLAQLEHFGGTVEKHDVIRMVLISVPVILVCMGMLAVLNRYVTGNTENTGASS